MPISDLCQSKSSADILHIFLSVYSLLDRGDVTHMGGINEVSVRSQRADFHYRVFTNTFSDRWRRLRQQSGDFTGDFAHRIAMHIVIIIVHLWPFKIFFLIILCFLPSNYIFNNFHYLFELVELLLSIISKLKPGR